MIKSKQSNSANTYVGLYFNVIKFFPLPSLQQPSFSRLLTAPTCSTTPICMFPSLFSSCSTSLLTGTVDHINPRLVLALLWLVITDRWADLELTPPAYALVHVSKSVSRSFSCASYVPVACWSTPRNCANSPGSWTNWAIATVAFFSPSDACRFVVCQNPLIRGYIRSLFIRVQRIVQHDVLDGLATKTTWTERIIALIDILKVVNMLTIICNLLSHWIPHLPDWWARASLNIWEWTVTGKARRYIKRHARTTSGVDHVEQPWNTYRLLVVVIHWYCVLGD